MHSNSNTTRSTLPCPYNPGLTDVCVARDVGVVLPNCVVFRNGRRLQQDTIIMMVTAGMGQCGAIGIRGSEYHKL
jgi:hypothetical protein